MNYCCTIQLAANFLRYFVSQIVTYFSVCVSLFEEDSEIAQFIDSFVLHTGLDFVSMAVIFYLNSAVVNAVSLKLIRSRVGMDCLQVNREIV